MTKATIIWRGVLVAYAALYATAPLTVDYWIPYVEAHKALAGLITVVLLVIPFFGMRHEGC